MSTCQGSCREKNDGIYCTVANCTYHTKDNCCTANQIKVDCQSATTKSETNCSTFELKD